MAKFKKAILKADRDYHSPDGVVHVTAKRLRDWADKFNQMKAAGLAIPVSWGHSDNPTLDVPVKFSSKGKSRSPEGTVGYLHSVKPSADGKSAEIELDIRGLVNNRKVEDNLAFVSPVIRETWPDGEGKIWTDVWGHMDLVQHPVDNSQTPFKRVEGEAIACALRMGLDSGKPTTYRMADHEMPKDDDNTGHDEGENNEGDRVKRVIDALSAMSIVLPDDTSQENFFERVEGALLTAAAMGGGETMETGTEGLEQAAPEFAALSLDTPIIKYASGELREKVGNRLDDYLKRGKLAPHEHKAKKAALSTVRLSLDKDGKHTPTEVETWLDSREAVPDGTFWSDEQRTRMSGLQEVPHPESLGGEITEERAEEIVDEVFKK